MNPLYRMPSIWHSVFFWNGNCTYPPLNEIPAKNRA